MFPSVVIFSPSSLNRFVNFFLTLSTSCKLIEVGIKCDQGVSSTPDLLIVDNEGNLLYTVMVKEQNEGDIFDCCQESLATLVMDAYFYKSSHGSILIQYSNSSMVADKRFAKHNFCRKSPVKLFACG